MFCAVTVNAVSVVNATSVPSVIVAFNGILNPEEQLSTPVTACVDLILCLLVKVIRHRPSY